MGFLNNEIYLIAITFIAFGSAKLLHRRFHVTLLNPILISTILLLLYMAVTDTQYESYRAGGQYIEFWLKPAVVALGVPLYHQLSNIKKQLLPLLISELAGCVVGIVSVVVIAKLLDSPTDLILSLVPKSVTTPIAIEISETIGGIPALTSAVVICTGIFGNLAGFKIVKMSRIKSPIAGSLSVGTAAHAIGSAAAIEKGERYGAFSSLGMTMNGLFTALLTPFILRSIGII
ncbi:MAG: LrgB family protein [Bacteroides sp.]|nr:LrgB family protein [Bacteroides sp.]